MPEETMNGRERMAGPRQVVERRIEFPWTTGPLRNLTEKLCKYLGCGYEEMLTRLHIDTPLTAAGRYVGPPLDDGADV